MDKWLSLINDCTEISIHAWQIFNGNDKYHTYVTQCHISISLSHISIFSTSSNNGRE